MSQAATLKANNMFEQNYWSHYGPNGSTPWDYILKSGYQYEYAGENLAKNFLFSQGVVDGWMDSETHKNNILRKDYTDVGFAIVNGTLNNEPTTLVVQMFGKPLEQTSLTKSFSPPAVQAAEKKQETEIIKTAPSQIVVNSKSNKLSLTNIPLNMNMIFLSFLLIALGLDFYFATKLNIVRIGGKNIAHIIFISFIFVGLIVFTKGAIL